jgi:O-antigen/teichoic acid export membrane protein
VVLATAPFALLVLHAPFVLRIVLGPGWDETAHYLMWLAPASLLAFVSGWLDRMLDKLGQQRLAVILQLCYDALSLGLLIALLASGYSAITSIAAYCLASTVYCGVWLLVAFQRAGYALASLGKLTALAAGLVGALVAVHWLVGGALAQPWALFVETLLALGLQFLAWRYTRASFALSMPPSAGAGSLDEEV